MVNAIHSTMHPTTPPDPTPRSPSPSPVELVLNNDDLLTQILSHLPIKPLLRFKSISKRFHSLISHPHFCLLHTHLHSLSPPSALFLLHSFLPLSLPPSPPPPFFSLLNSSPLDNILQSCHGLLLCSSSRIFNPTTNQFLPLFPPPRSISGLALAFDPSRSLQFHVLCVAKMDESFDSNSFSIDVYSSRDKQWSPVVDLFTAPFDVEFERGVYCDGRVYWLSHTETTVGFDLDNRCVVHLNLPRALHGAYIERFRYFGECCGHLHLVEIRTNCVSDFDVLELDGREKKEWLVKFRVNLDVVGRGFEREMFQDHSDRFRRRFRFYAFSILAVVRGKQGDDDDDGDSELVVSVPGKVIAYNFKNRVSRLISNVVDESDRWLPFKGYNAYQFIESLYCL